MNPSYHLIVIHRIGTSDIFLQVKEGGIISNRLLMSNIAISPVESLQHRFNASFDGSTLALAEYWIEEKQRYHGISTEVGQEPPGTSKEFVGIRQERQRPRPVRLLLDQVLRPLVEYLYNVNLGDYANAISIEALASVGLN